VAVKQSRVVAVDDRREVLGRVEEPARDVASREACAHGVQPPAHLVRRGRAPEDALVEAGDPAGRRRAVLEVVLVGGDEAGLDLLDVAPAAHLLQPEGQARGVGAAPEVVLVGLADEPQPVLVGIGDRPGDLAVRGALQQEARPRRLAQSIGGALEQVLVDSRDEGQDEVLRDRRPRARRRRRRRGGRRRSGGLENCAGRGGCASRGAGPEAHRYRQSQTGDRRQPRPTASPASTHLPAPAHRGDLRAAVRANDGRSPDRGQDPRRASWSVRAFAGNAPAQGTFTRPTAVPSVSNSLRTKSSPRSPSRRPSGHQPAQGRALSTPADTADVAPQDPST